MPPVKFTSPLAPEPAAVLLGFVVLAAPPEPPVAETNAPKDEVPPAPPAFAPDAPAVPAAPTVTVTPLKEDVIFLRAYQPPPPEPPNLLVAAAVPPEPPPPPTTSTMTELVPDVGV